MNKRTLRINELYNHFGENQFSFSDLYNFYLEIEPNLKEGTARWRVHYLKRYNVINTISKGIYELIEKETLEKYKMDFSNNRFVVFTADIIDYKKCNINQTLIKEKLALLNNIPFKSKVTNFELSRGDEFQILCTISKEIPKIIRSMRYFLTPYKIRIGLGIGKIEEMLTDNSWEMSGEAFFYARNALDEISSVKDYSLVLNSSNKKLDNTINLVYKLIDSLIVNKWSAKQWEAIQYYDEYKTYDIVANLLDISKSSVSQRCNSANWDIYSDAENKIAEIIMNYYMQT